MEPIILVLPDWVYAELLSKNTNVEELLDIYKVINGYKNDYDIKKGSFSVNTLYMLETLNDYSNNLFDQRCTNNFTEGSVNQSFYYTLGTDIKKNVNIDLKEFLLCKNSIDDVSITKYYECKIIPEGIMLVIIKKGFYSHLVETKDNYIKFILECLELAYNYSPLTVTPSVAKLLGTYLFYNSQNNYETLFKAKLLNLKQ